ncbi:MAG: ChaN family lipoprotein, partial [Thermodesulfobacteriota bacterium]
MKTAILGLTILFLIGCSAAPPLQPLILKGSFNHLRPGDIVETATGAFLSLDSLIDNLSKYPIIYVGETHPSVEDHRLQQEILKGLYGRNPSLMVAMEMFPREVQPWLDQYSQGL